MKYLIYTNSILQFLMMLFVPYQILAIQQNTNNLPLVLGVGMVAGGTTSIIIGKLSDRNRRLTFLFGMLLLVLVVVSYAFADSLLVIIILQALYGVAFAVYNISEKAIIADKAINKGYDIGKYATALYVASGIALIISSVFIINIQYIFPAIAIGLLIPNIIIYKYIK